MASAIAKMRKPKTVEANTVRIAIIQDGLTVGELAARCGMSSLCLSAAITSNFPCQRTRHRVEAGLGYTRAIWSDASTLAQRKKCVLVFGFDPYLVERDFMRSQAAAIRADFSGCYSKADFIKEVFARAAVTNPKPTAPQPSEPHTKQS
ncbi:MAG: hypothetical protein JWR69_4736 [Pedosphaera sp.]|nr:hypothetical protein [Pedosphaera sp.]